MTAFAICMTALSGFLLGIIFANNKPRKATRKVKVSPQKNVDAYSSQEYLNFLNYDGTTQI